MKIAPAAEANAKKPIEPEVQLRGLVSEGIIPRVQAFLGDKPYESIALIQKGLKLSVHGCLDKGDPITITLTPSTQSASTEADEARESLPPEILVYRNGKMVLSEVTADEQNRTSLGIIFRIAQGANEALRLGAVAKEERFAVTQAMVEHKFRPFLNLLDDLGSRSESLEQ